MAACAVSETYFGGLLDLPNTGLIKALLSPSNSFGGQRLYKGLINKGLLRLCHAKTTKIRN